MTPQNNGLTDKNILNQKKQWRIKHLSSAFFNSNIKKHGDDFRDTIQLKHSDKWQKLTFEWFHPLNIEIICWSHSNDLRCLHVGSLSASKYFCQWNHYSVGSLFTWHALSYIKHNQWLWGFTTSKGFGIR